MHVDEVLWDGEDWGGAAWESSHRCCVMRKVMRKEMVAGGRFDFFLGSGRSHIKWLVTTKYQAIQSFHKGLVFQ